MFLFRDIYINSTIPICYGKTSVILSLNTTDFRAKLKVNKFLISSMSGNSQRKNKNNSVLTIEADPKDKQSEQAQLLSYVRGMFENLKEDIKTTYDEFITYFTENGDTTNNCNIKFNHLENFTVTTEEEINGFFFLSTLIRLPDRLKAVPAIHLNA